MKRSNRTLFLAFTAFISFVLFQWPSPVSAQVLSWQYENILTDLQQSGANPDVDIDAAGNIHVSYWQRSEEKLVYGKRTKATGQWDFTTIAETGLYGYKSAIKVDDLGLVHIAFLKRIGDEAFLYYATNRTGGWQTESVFTASSLGPYFEGTSYPYIFKHSLDIEIQGNGKPVILFFNGKILSTAFCQDGNIGQYYSFYELNSNLVAQELNDSWNYIPLSNVPYTGLSNCLASGDRFGEFGRILPGVGNNYYVMTNSMHNDKVLWFESSPGSLNTWEYATVDSLERAYNISSSTSLFWETFDGLTVDQSPDSQVHMMYITSRLYGKLASNNSRKRFYYTRFHPDSLGSPTYTPYYKEVTGRDGYKDNFAIHAKSADSVYAAYHYANTGQVIASQSFNGGQNWFLDTLFNAPVTAQMKMAAHGDSLFLLAYREDLDYLTFSRRSFANDNWVTENATVNENRATILSSEITRNGPDDEIRMFFDELQNGILSYGERIGGSWSFEEIATANHQFLGVSLGKLSNGEPCAAFSRDDPQNLWFAYRENGNWQFNTIETGEDFEDLSLVMDGNTAHLSYYVSSQGELRYAKATDATTGNWATQVVDNSSLIVGQHANMQMDANGVLHLAYVDVFNARTRYGSLGTNGAWSISNITATQEYNPSFLDLKIRSDNRPVVALRDAGTNSLVVGENPADTTWVLTNVVGDVSNLVGAPLKLILDDKDRPWVLYNYITATNEMRLVRRDGAGQWNQVSVLNNFNQIANVFDFHLVGEDFYILGKQNRTSNQGLGMLYAANGVNTHLEAQLDPASLEIYPNPVTDHQISLRFSLKKAAEVEVGLYNLQGQMVHHWGETPLLPAGPHERELDVADVAPGLYLLVLESAGQRIHRKLVVGKL